MRQIPASLPAIGAFRVHLHSESARLVDFFGDEELARLGRIDHLGAATAAFPGINHTRLEYVLLQCAITQLVAKLYKDNKDLALANKVELDGTSASISSGEELLKCWAILGNVGHPNWTFATERALIDGALKSTKLRSWLISGAIETDLRGWARDVIETHDDRRVRLLLTLLRLRTEHPHDSRKHLFRQMIRNRVLPQGVLKFSSASAREKLSRLRSLSQNIQLLSMVTLDAYHSHSPVRLELLPAIQELSESAFQTARLGRFLSVVTATAGWLADEVYLHPQAVAVQRAYEVRGARSALKRFNEQGGTSFRRAQLLKAVMTDGFGQPRVGFYQPLVRLTFPQFSARLLGSGHRPARIARLNSEIAVRQSSLVSVEDNRFSRSTHVDVLCNPRNITGPQLGQTYQRLAIWLLRAIETESLERVRRIFRPDDRDEDRVEASRLRILKSAVRRSEGLLVRVVCSLVQNLIPEGWTVGLEDMSEQERGPSLGWQITDSRNKSIDELTLRIDELHTDLVSLGNSARARDSHSERGRWLCKRAFDCRITETLSNSRPVRTKKR